MATESMTHVRQLADAVNCTAAIHPSPTGTSPDQPQTTGPISSDEYNSRLITCFKKVPARTLTDVELTGVPRYRTGLGPNVDRRMVLPADVRTLVGKQSDLVFGSTALMIGVTRDEGQVFFGEHELEEVSVSFLRRIGYFIRQVSPGVLY